MNVNDGTLTLSGANTYSGATTVASGANLIVVSGGAGLSAITMNGATTFTENVITAGGQWNLTNNLTFTDNSSVLALNFNNNTLSATLARRSGQRHPQFRRLLLDPGRLRQLAAERRHLSADHRDWHNGHRTDLREQERDHRCLRA